MRTALKWTLTVLTHVGKFGNAQEDSKVYLEDPGNGRRESNPTIPSHLLVPTKSSQSYNANPPPSAAISAAKHPARWLEKALDELPSGQLDLRLPAPPSSEARVIVQVPPVPTKQELVDALCQDLESL